MAAGQRRGYKLGQDEYDTSEAYLNRVTQRLKAEHFRIENNITYKNQTFECVARRTRFEIDKYGFVTTFFLFANFPSLNMDSLKDFSAKSFRYAERATVIPLPRGLFCGIFCFPVAIVDSIDIDTAEMLRSYAPPKHWSASEMPVVYSLASKILYYCEVTPMWGALYYDPMRLTINYMLAP